MTPMMRRNAAWLPSVFNDLFDNDFMPKANATAPAINVKETDKAYTVELAAPGMTPEAVVRALSQAARVFRKPRLIERYLITSILVGFDERIHVVIFSIEKCDLHVYLLPSPGCLPPHVQPIALPTQVRSQLVRLPRALSFEHYDRYAVVLTTPIYIFSDLGALLGKPSSFLAERSQ